uniref:Gypsy retrotransposon integrase-like protein 1 n=1 Tax=Nothobranchius furzeri TaxID=105023 RepID=A0A8C6NU34_NOTFU
MEEMIRDHIVVGIRDSRLSERLQLDPDLTLAKTITQAWQQEEIKKQQQLLRGGHTESKGANVDAINTNRGRPRYRQTPPRRPEQFMSMRKNVRDAARARNTLGNGAQPRRRCVGNVKKKGHFAAVCRSSQRVETLVESDPEEDIAFMGSVNTDETEEERLKKLNFNGENVTFKLDTGASVTAVPASMYSEVRDGSLLAPSKKIKGPDNCPLKVLGVMRAHIKSEKTETRQDVYVVSNLVMPLMGLPAIIKLNLIKQVASVQQEKQEKCHQYKTMFPKVFTGLGKLEGAYKIKLKEGVVPYALSAPRRVPLPMKEQVKQELDRMEAMGVIRRIEEPNAWCAGMVVVPKQNKKPRICVDLTRLNENVCRERHILPAVDDTLAQLEGAKVFSKLDATSGFWQVPLHKDSQPSTNFITPFGRYCFQRLPFGISSAPEHFQLRISQIIAGEKGALCHADDILVFGKDKAEHDERLQQVLKRCEKAGLTLNEKCEFSVERVKFLGHNISATGIEADPDKISAIENMPEPRNVEEVRRFLGMVNYVGKFSSSLPALTKPLRDLLKSDSTWTWDAQQRTAFEKIKEELSSPPVLAQYSPTKETMVSADASSYGLGAVLLQRQADDRWRPVMYISRSLTPTEVQYAQIEKEALAATWACERLSSYLLGLEFTVRTDHKPLVSLFGSRALDDLPPRILRFRLRLLRFNYKIIHVPGKQLVTADTLSRAPQGLEDREANSSLQQECCMYVYHILRQLPATKSKLSHIMDVQSSDSVCKQLKTFTEKGWPSNRRNVPEHLPPFWPERTDIHLAEGLLLKGKRILIPACMQTEMLDRLHEGPQGVTKCVARAQESLWWSGITRQIKDMVESCEICCQFSQTKTEPLMTTPLPPHPWQKVAADIFQWKNSHYVVVVDYFS